MFSTLCYGSAWCGRELDGHHIWEWKSHWMADPMDRARAVRVLGLDWMDVVWGFVMVAVMGLLFLLVSGCCCMFRGDDDDDADSNRCRNCGGCGSCAGPWYLGDCGGASGGEGLVLIMLVVALIVGIFGAFIGIYGIIARFNSRALDSMKETILEVK
ncbi:hypothetical protein EDD11_006138 [Mortierella claussenii]|nr:hypothetical protein EDD11_006138 [Mortierella claussenii]